MNESIPNANPLTKTMSFPINDSINLRQSSFPYDVAFRVPTIETNLEEFMDKFPFINKAVGASEQCVNRLG